MLLGSKRGSLMPVSGDQLAQWTKFDPRIGSLVRGGFVRMGEEIVDFSLTRRDTQGLLQGYATHLRGSIDVSDSGKYARELARRFGGLSEAVAALTSAVFAPLLWEYNPASGDRMGKTKLRDRRYLSHGAACQALGGSLSETERRDYMSELVERGLIHYGLLLTCPRCSSTEFYRWADMGERYVICIRCREEFQVTPSRFRYWEPTAMLAEVAFLGLFEKHALEEIALAAALEKDSAAALELGVRWRLPEGAGFLELETDVVGSVDGEFVIGEAKSVAKLNSEDNKQLNRLSRLAELTHARRLVIGTSEPQWPPPALKRLTELATRVHGVRVEAWANVLGKPQGTSINATGKWP
jgi:hypothetical protein